MNPYDRPLWPLMAWACCSCSVWAILGYKQKTNGHLRQVEKEQAAHFYCCSIALRACCRVPQRAPPLQHYFKKKHNPYVRLRWRRSRRSSKSQSVLNVASCSALSRRHPKCAVPQNNHSSDLHTLYIPGTYFLTPRVDIYHGGKYFNLLHEGESKTLLSKLPPPAGSFATKTIWKDQ